MTQMAYRRRSKNQQQRTTIVIYRSLQIESNTTIRLFTFLGRLKMIFDSTIVLSFEKQRIEKKN